MPIISDPPTGLVWKLYDVPNTPGAYIVPILDYRQPGTANRFGIGQRVRIARPNGTGPWTKLVGMLGTITDRHTDDRGSWYEVTTDDTNKSSGWVWFDEELDPIVSIMPNKMPEAIVVRPFWLVWREPTPGAEFPAYPTKQHATELEACNEAARLSRLHPGARFVALKAIAAEEQVARTTYEPRHVEYGNKL